MAHFREGAVAVVAVESTSGFSLWELESRVVEDGGNIPIEITVVIVVTDGATHAILITIHAGQCGAVGEGAVTVVPKQFAGIEVARDGEVGPAVGVEIAEKTGEGELAIGVEIGQRNSRG